MTAKKNIFNKNQSGLSLVIVLIIILLAMLISLWAARSSFFNELVVGNETDYQRAYEAAEALIQDAEADIGKNATSTCTRPTGATAAVCRPSGYKQFILEGKEITPFLNDLSDIAVTQCVDAICSKRTAYQDWWKNPTQLTAMRLVGARYGTYTGAIHSDKSNPLLNATTTNQGGYYWIEVMDYENASDKQVLINSSSKNALSINASPSVAYRITAVVQGLKDSTRAVIQSTYVLNKLDN